MNLALPGRRAGAVRRDPDGRMTLVEHLYELRSRLFRALLAFAAGMIIAFIFYQPLFHWLTRPYCQLPAAHRLDAAHRLGGDQCLLTVTGVFDAFSVRLKVSMLCGSVLSAPVWLYQLWSFITPGLHRNERRWALTFVGTSLALFGLGASFAYLTLPKGLAFLLSFASGDVIPLITIDRYLGFVQAMLLVFGISFEFPLLVVLLNLTGLVSAEKLRGWRRMEIFLVFVFAAFITPSGDPFSMTAMAVPMCVFYEVALLVAKRHDRRVARRDAELGLDGVALDEVSPLPPVPPDRDDDQPTDRDEIARLR